MKLSDIIPDAELLLALEPEELGLRMLPAFADATRYDNNLTRDTFIQIVMQA